MKQFFKNLCKSLSLILVVAISFISFTACSNNDNKQAAVTPTTESISDTSGSNDDEIIADEVTNENKETSGESDEDSLISDITEGSNEESDNTSTSEYPVFPGIYNHSKENLTFSDIYFTVTEAELLEYFETRDLNGVYGAVQKLGFDEFIKSITTYTEGEISYKTAISLHKNESDGSQLGLSTFYIKNANSFVDLGEMIVYSVEDGKIVIEDGKPAFIIDGNNVSILYQFSYVDAETNETIYTPLYVKSDLTIYDEIDIMHDESLSSSYHYLDLSASIESATGFLNESESMKKLAEMLKVDESEIISTLENFELYFSDDKELYICNTEENFILTEKVDGETTYLLYDSCYISVVNEVYDLTFGLKLLNIEIQIDEANKFVCTFYDELI